MQTFLVNVLPDELEKPGSLSPDTTLPLQDRTEIKLNKIQVIQKAFNSPGFSDRSAVFHKRTVLLH